MSTFFSCAFSPKCTNTHTHSHSYFHACKSYGKNCRLDIFVNINIKIVAYGFWVLYNLHQSVCIKLAEFDCAQMISCMCIMCSLCHLIKKKIGLKHTACIAPHLMKTNPKSIYACLMQVLWMCVSLCEWCAFDEAY